MSQFYDVVNNREFEQIKERYHSSRMIMRKVWEKIEEIDGMRDNVSIKVHQRYKIGVF